MDWEGRRQSVRVRMVVLLLVILQQVVQGLLELLEILLLRSTFRIPLLRRLLRLFLRIRDANYRFRESEKMQLILLSVIVSVRFGLLVDKRQQVSREWE